jgi:hypothetical protein
MPHASAPDGAEIYYEGRGSGPLVVIGSYWSATTTEAQGSQPTPAPMT